VAVHYSEDQDVWFLDAIERDVLAHGKASRSEAEVFITYAPDIGMFG
jgi:hypothetical protein